MSTNVVSSLRWDLLRGNLSHQRGYTTPKNTTDESESKTEYWISDNLQAQVKLVEKVSFAVAEVLVVLSLACLFQKGRSFAIRVVAFLGIGIAGDLWNVGKAAAAILKQDIGHDSVLAPLGRNTLVAATVHICKGPVPLEVEKG